MIMFDRELEIVDIGSIPTVALAAMRRNTSVRVTLGGQQ